MEAEYLIAADGAHSTVRKSLEIPFVGTTLQQRWSLADVKLRAEFPEDHANIFVGENSFLFALCMQPGIFRVASNSDHVLRELANVGDIEDVLWQSEFTVHHRTAQRVQVGNVALIGDAAHVHSPLGARGMNLGIEDAAILSRRLVDRQWMRYGQERPRAHQKIVKQIRWQTEIVEGRGWRQYLQRLAPVLLRSSYVQRAFAERLLAVRGR